MDLIGWVIFIVALLVSVMLHETGHFVLAKKFGMKVTRYFVGFGPTIWSTWRGETEYGIKAIPLGGFVKIVGMHSLDDPDDPEDEVRAFRITPGLAADPGPVRRLGHALHPGPAAGLRAGARCRHRQRQRHPAGLRSARACPPVSPPTTTAPVPRPHPASPAKLAGLRVGDMVTAFDGHPVSNFTQLGDAIRAVPPGSAVTITVRRDGKLVTLHTKLASVSGRSGSYLGIGPAGAVPGGQPAGSDRVLGHDLRPGAGRLGPGRHGAAQGAAQAVRQEPVERVGAARSSA